MMSKRESQKEKNMNDEVNKLRRFESSIDSVQILDAIVATFGPFQLGTLFDGQVRDYRAPKSFHIDFHTTQRVENGCFEQFLIDSLHNRPGFTNITRQSIKEDLIDITGEDRDIRYVRDLVAYCTAKGIGLYLIDPLMEEFYRFVRPDTDHSKPVIYGRINNGHIQAILSKEMQSAIIHRHSPTVDRVNWKGKVETHITQWGNPM